MRRLTDENLSLHHELYALHHELDPLHHELDTLRRVLHAFSDFPCEQLLPYGIVTGDGFFEELAEEGTGHPMGFMSAVEPVHHPLQKPWVYRPTNGTATSLMPNLFGGSLPFWLIHWAYMRHLPMEPILAPCLVGHPWRATVSSPRSLLPSVERLVTMEGFASAPEGQDRWKAVTIM